MKTLVKCPVCNASKWEIFWEIDKVPVLCNLLCRTEEEALQVPKGKISLAFCEKCSHVFNASFDKALIQYSPDYENSLFYSAHFRQYAQDIANKLVNRYDLYNKTIVEIGCGQGEFLSLLCQLGNNRGIGFDPGFRGENDLNGRVEIIQDAFSEKYRHLQADFVCCRHVLEHLSDPVPFLHNVRKMLENGNPGVAFFEVPNFRYTLQEVAIWDIIYEHVGYYTPVPLANLFRQCAFEVLNMDEPYDRQYLTIEAIPCRRHASEDHLSEDFTSKRQIKEFKARANQKIVYWRNYLRQENKYVVIWGAGSKGVTFLNVVDIERKISCAVDINPYKKGKFIPGTGHKIIASKDLQKNKAKKVLISNSYYFQEIKNMLNKLNISSNIQPI